ncbi:MAG: excinuclease ABC subunit UvrB [SAR202 cluster bacterium]|nr:excinuclease ABC subunit UvrB [SAR202 cluster bacterium]
MENKFKIESELVVMGDQAQAITGLVDGVNQGIREQTLLGATGSGKTFTMANVIEKVQKPSLVIAHNKTLAAQLVAEFSEFFPNNAVEYFVSYYDYYQPEAYIPQTDTYIEKDAGINEEIDRLRHAATSALLSRRDVIVVASVSCIFGLGSPDEYRNFIIDLKKDTTFSRDNLIRRLVDMQYDRNDVDLSRGKFRVRGDTVEIVPVDDEDHVIRIEFWGDVVDRILALDPLSGEILGDRDSVLLYPAKHFVSSDSTIKLALSKIRSELEDRLTQLNKEGKLLEAERLESRTNYDMEMIAETGYCSGVENYSVHLSDRELGSTPYTLLDYFPSDYLIFIDESHMTLPQIRAMFTGDRSRKESLVDHGFRLPSAMDNRPLIFNEFMERINQCLYVSATPSKYEYERSGKVVEQIIRPTGLVDPTIEIKPTHGQIDDLLNQVKKRIDKGQRSLVTTLTKRMAEELAEYLKESGVKTHYLHSEIDTLERTVLLRDLRLGVYDVIVGINLLREGIDLPEVSLILILDADKEGFLRSTTSLVQIIGRAARHIDGHVIMYADTTTDSMKRAINETGRRRTIQQEYNEKHNIEPQSIRKNVTDIIERIRGRTEIDSRNINLQGISKSELRKIMIDLRKEMKMAAKNLEFEKAAMLRDQIFEIKNQLLE